MNIKENCKIRTQRGVCLACGHALLEQPLLELPDMPASAQDIPEKNELPFDCGVKLRLRQCPACGLVQFDCEPVDYYRDVIRAVGLSETMRELRRADYRHMLETYGLSGKKFIECGCGRGEFMEVLKEFPAKIYATEANAEFAAAAQELLGPGCHVMHMFPEDSAVPIPGAPFDCFFSFNFLEHQPDPSAMLGCMYYNLAPGGYGLITVPSFEYILKDGRYYELIRDHIANYTLSSLTAFCESCGFEILEKGRIGIGDTLRVVVRKPESTSLEQAVHAACAGIFAAFQKECSAGAEMEREAAAAQTGLSAGGSCEKCGTAEPTGGEELRSQTEEHTEKCGTAAQADSAQLHEQTEQHLLVEAERIPCDVSALKRNYEELRAQMAAYVERLKARHLKLALFGAGHQGFTIAATTALCSYAEYIMDSAPFKQGKYAPASHIPIVSPNYFAEHPVDVVMVTAPGYVREITAQLRKLYPERTELQICTIEPESWTE